LESRVTKTLVIGGSGFLGTSVTRRLALGDRDVVVMGRRRKPSSPIPVGVRYLATDFETPAGLEPLLDGVDEVVHLAYSTVPKTSFEDPVFDVLSNLPGTVRLFQAAATSGVKKFLLVSSGGTVYGITDHLPIDEDHPTNPISPYGISKLTLEKYASMFHVTAGLPVIIVRPANAYGEEQRTQGGQGFIAAAMRAILRGQQVTVFGARGTVRDYVHVSDVASGIVAALEHGDVGATYNIGTGVGRDNLEVLTEIEQHASSAGLPILTRILPPRVYDVPANVLESRRLTAVSGWRPEVSFASGIGQVWDAVSPLRRP
jgi:UDP-glucose 4-epimerase